MPTTPTLPTDGVTTVNAALFATYRTAILELQAAGANVQLSISQTAHGFAEKDVLRYGTGSFAKARANLEANCIDVVGIVVSVTDANTFVLHFSGQATGLDAGLTANTVYYLSEATAGLLTATKPTSGYILPILKTQDVATTALMLPMGIRQAVLPVTEGGTGATTASAARTSLGLVIGTDVQAYHATLAAVAGGSYVGAASITTLGTIATGVWQGTAVAVAYGGTGATSAGDARTNLGLGTIATQAANNVNITGGSVTGITDLAVADGGTGASTAADARTNLGAAAASHSHAQSDVTNLTTDLAAKAPLASPTFTGTPAAPTAAPGTNTTQVATTAFVTAAVAAVPVGLSFEISANDGTQDGWTVDAGTWSVTADDTWWNGYYFGNVPSHANNDAAHMTITVPVTGTYIAYVKSAKNAGHGIVELLIDGVSKGTWDAYNATLLNNIFSSGFNLGSLMAGTQYELKVKVNGKNASSTDYYLVFNSILLVKQ